MNETGLIVAEVAFLVLLYAFVWSIVRSAGRQIRAASPAPVAAPEHHVAPMAAPAAAPAAVAVAEAAVAPVEAAWEPPPVPMPPDPPADAAPDQALTVPPDDDGIGRLDLAGNLDPRLIVEASPTLEVGLELPLEGGMTIGRSDAAELSLVDAFVSHMHARILRRGTFHFVEDLGSTNGTFLNDIRVERDAQLKVHDTLRIGQTILRYAE